MKIEKFWEVWDNLGYTVKILKQLLILTLVVLFFSVILNLRLATRKEKILIVPGATGRMELTPGEIPSQVVRDFAIYVVSLYASYHPEDFEKRMNTLIEHVSPSLYPSLKKEILENREKIYKTSYSQIFTVDSVSVKTEGNMYQVYVSGILEKLIGDSRIGKERRIYAVTFKKGVPTPTDPIPLVITSLHAEE